MNTQKMIGDLPGKVLGLLVDLMQKLKQCVITVQELELFLQRKNPFAITDIRQEWTEFYRRYFRLSVDFTDVNILDDPGGFERIIFIPHGLAMTSVIKAMKKHFKVYTYTNNLDKDVNNNVRSTQQSYTIRFRERVEADQELKNTSANKLKEDGVNTITLLERLVYELKYFSETGQHLDVDNVTLCAGSRNSVGDVPRVYWHAGVSKLHVYWYDPVSAHDSLRARQAVS